MSLLIKDVQLDSAPTDVLIEGNRFKTIASGIDETGHEILSGAGRALIPGFINMHTHASMSLLRGYADDLHLHDWLNNHIWPLEAELTEEDIYHGARLACLEMIKSGTTCFNDMYWYYHGVARAVEEMGLRATLSSVFIDLNDAERAAAEREQAVRLFEESRRYSDRLSFALGPHAIYTVSKTSLKWAKAFAREHGLRFHIHLSETEKEVEDCLSLYGLRPVQWLEKIGLLDELTLAAHVVHVTDAEIGILADCGVEVVHNPVSNMKLASGSFPFQKMERAGVKLSLGTDGASSNNNLCMLEEMKIAAMQAKVTHGDPTVLPAQTVFEMATCNGARALGLETGAIREGLLADCVLVDLDNPRLVPGFSLIDDLVYSADSSCIDTVICDGRILMRDGHVDGEEEIIAEARRYKKRFQ
ncbi:amidohydrolase [Pontiella sp.]|uniref:amidohydrolase n=1 Tax=Pontiella sp. TaxID=2837462 RepID=UPI003565A4FA